MRSDAIKELDNWAEQNLDKWTCKITDTLTKQFGYEKIWFLNDEHEMIRLRLMKHDTAYWLILQCCSQSYGANEDDWQSVNLGTIYGLDEIKALCSSFTQREKDDEISLQKKCELFDQAMKKYAWNIKTESGKDEEICL